MDTSPRQPAKAAATSTTRHAMGFVVSGLLATGTDATILETGVRLVGLPASIARLGAIAAAMVVGWLAHRRLTFSVASPPTFREFARFASAASITAMVNYITFVGLLLANPALPRLFALVGSTAVATIFAYIAMRYAVFVRTSRNDG